MKRTVLNVLGVLAVCSTLNLQLSTALAQGSGYRLLTTFTNPTPASGDWFGKRVAAVGNDRVLIGAYGDDTGATNAGAAYLFSIPSPMPKPPSLTIRITLPTPWPSRGLRLRPDGHCSKTPTARRRSTGTMPPGPIQDDGTTKTLIVSPSAENRFYRLFKP